MHLGTTVTTWPLFCLLWVCVYLPASSERSWVAPLLSYVIGRCVLWCCSRQQVTYLRREKRVVQSVAECTRFTCAVCVHFRTDRFNRFRDDSERTDRGETLIDWLILSIACSGIHHYGCVRLQWFEFPRRTFVAGLTARYMRMRLDRHQTTSAATYH